MQKLAELNFVYDIKEMWNEFVSYFECSKTYQKKKFAFSWTSDSC